MNSLTLSFFSPENEMGLLSLSRARIPWTSVYIPVVLGVEMLFLSDESNTRYSGANYSGERRDEWYYGNHNYEEEGKFIGFDCGFAKPIGEYLFPYVVTGPVLNYTYGSGWRDNEYITHHHFEEWDWNVGGGLIVKLPMRGENSIWYFDVGWDSAPEVLHFGFVWSH